MNTNKENVLLNLKSKALERLDKSYLLKECREIRYAQDNAKD